MAIEQMGLSNYEARAYEALLRVDSADAFLIAQKSGVPTGRIYSVLSELGRKNIIEVQNTRPKMFRAVEPKAAIERLLDTYRKEIDAGFEAYRERAAEIEKKLSKRSEKEGNLFWTISVDKSRFSELISSREEYVQKELLICTGGLELEDYQQLEQFTQLFASLLKKGVYIRLLLSKDDHRQIERLAKMAMTPSKKNPQGKYAFLPLLLRFLGDGFQIRFSEGTSVPFDVMDGSEVMLKIRNPAKSSEYFAVMAIRNPKMAQELKKKFLDMWGKAEELKLEACGAKNKRSRGT